MATRRRRIVPSVERVRSDVRRRAGSVPGGERSSPVLLLPVLDRGSICRAWTPPTADRGPSAPAALLLPRPIASAGRNAPARPLVPLFLLDRSRVFDRGGGAPPPLAHARAPQRRRLPTAWTRLPPRAAASHGRSQGSRATWTRACGVRSPVRHAGMCACCLFREPTRDTIAVETPTDRRALSESGSCHRHRGQR